MTLLNKCLAPSSNSVSRGCTQQLSSSSSSSYQTHSSPGARKGPHCSSHSSSY